LNSVFKQTLKPLEIIVVDDGSTDSTYGIASSFPVIVIKHGINLGLATARNTGLGSARGEIVSFLDSDCLASEKWLENIAEDFSSLSLVGVGGRGIEINKDNLIDLHRSLHGSQTLGLAKKYVNMLHGLCFSFRREVLEKIGGFDKYFRTNGEDVDICLRLYRRGFQLFYDPNVVVFHLRQDDLKSYLNANYRAYKYGFYAQLKNVGYSKTTFGREVIRICLRFISKVVDDIRLYKASHTTPLIILSLLVSLTQILALHDVYSEILKNMGNPNYLAARAYMKQ